MLEGGKCDAQCVKTYISHPRVGSADTIPAGEIALFRLTAVPETGPLISPVTEGFWGTRWFS